VFGGLVLWFTGGGDDRLTAGLALACLCLGAVVSYAKARAEGLGMTANVGIAERADRLVAVLVTTGLVGLGLPDVVLTVVLAALALASVVTVVQRMLEVRRQALAAEDRGDRLPGPDGIGRPAGREGDRGQARRARRARRGTPAAS
jgi:CDP-diacylglycerol--glycerol-3-phosphate 3-phosphatidyltransferase